MNETFQAEFKGADGRTYAIEAVCDGDAVRWVAYDAADLALRPVVYRGKVRHDGYLRGLGPEPPALLGRPFVTWLTRCAHRAAKAHAAARSTARANPAKPAKPAAAPWYKDWTKLLGDD